MSTYHNSTTYGVEMRDHNAAPTIPWVDIGASYYNRKSAIATRDTLRSLPHNSDREFRAYRRFTETTTTTTVLD